METSSGDHPNVESFVPLLWSIPLSILIHNLEEYPRIVTYAQQHGIAINRRQMGIAIALATLLPIPLVIAAIKHPTSRRRLQVALAIPALITVNAGTHLTQTLILHDHSPGTITGLTINVPLAVWLYHQAMREDVLTPHQLRQAVVSGAVPMAPAALVLQLIGWVVDWAMQGCTR